MLLCLLGLLALPAGAAGVQAGQAAPPQSMSDSAPFFTPSPQLAARQTPPPQRPLGHCAPVLHCTHAPTASQNLPLP